MESKGVTYLNKGSINIVRLVVSMMTLRRHYSGDITVFLDGAHPEGFPDRLRDSFGADVVFDSENHENPFIRKIEVARDAPYDLSVFLDSDTLVVRAFDELFAMARDCDLVVVETEGYRTLPDRIRDFGEKCPEYIDAALSYGSYINTGVFARSKRSRIFGEWLDLAKWGKERGVGTFEEVACQVLLPRYNIKVAPRKFDLCAILHEQDLEDSRIMHYCGKRHCSGHLMDKLWVESFTEALNKDVCGIRSLSEWKNTNLLESWDQSSRLSVLIGQSEKENGN